MGRSINANYTIKDTILQSNDNKKNYKEKKYKIILLHESILFISYLLFFKVNLYAFLT